VAQLLTTLLRPERAQTSGRRATWLTVVGLILVPLTVGGLLTWALWQPLQRLDRVQAAVVNQDVPVEIEGQTVPLGRQLAAALVTSAGMSDDDAAADGGSGTDTGTDTDAGTEAGTDAGDTVANVSGSDSTENFTWSLTDADDAARGLADGTYATVVTIPESFSAAATSYSGDAAQAVQATIDIATSEKSKLVDAAVADAVTSTAVGLLNDQLTTAYLGNVYVGFNTLHEQLGAAAEGAGQLATGATQLGSGAAEVAAGTSSLATGVGELGSGAWSLADGVDQLADGAASLADGLEQIADQTAASAQQAAAAAPQTQAFTQGLDALASGVTGPGGLAGATTGLAEGATGVHRLAAGALDALKGPSDRCADGNASACQDVLRIVQEQVGSATPASGPTLAAAATAAGAVAAGASELDAAVNTGAAGRPALADAVTGLAQIGHGLADGLTASASGLGTLSGYLQQSADGARQLAGGAGAASDGAAELATGAQQAAAGAAQLSDGAAQLGTGADQLGTGAGDLASGLTEASGALPSYTEEEADTLAGVVAAPVTTGEELPAEEEEGLFGPTSVPFLVTVALWLGGLATFLLLGAVTRRALGSTRSPVVLALGSFAPAALIGLVQGVVITAAMAFAVDLSVGGWVAFTALAVLAGVAFAAVNQGLVALLGGVGRFVSVVVAVVGLAAAVISTVPAVFDAVVAATPLATALDGLQAVVNDSGGVGGAVVGLVLWMLAGLALTTVAVARRRVVPVRRLTQPLPAV
jgi:putative membrane protein